MNIVCVIIIIIMFPTYHFSTFVIHLNLLACSAGITVIIIVIGVSNVHKQMTHYGDAHFNVSMRYDTRRAAENSERKTNRNDSVLMVCCANCRSSTRHSRQIKCGE